MSKKIMIWGIILLLSLSGSIKGVLAMQLTSPAFLTGAYIPKQFTCRGKDTPPPLEWSEVPNATQTFTLIMDDPDAPNGTWDHWLLFNIPVHIQGFTENMA